MEKFNSILYDFAKKCGIKDLKINKGYCCFDIDDTQVHVKYEQKRNKMILISEIAELPQTNSSSILRYFLRINGSDELSKGMTFGYNKESNKITAGYMQPLRFMTSDSFDIKIRSMAKDIKEWAMLIEEFKKGKIPDGEIASNDSFHPEKDKAQEKKVEKPNKKDETKKKDETFGKKKFNNLISMTFLDVETIESYNKIELISKGFTSEVYKVTKDWKHYFVLKIFNPEICNTEDTNDGSDSYFTKVQQFIKSYEILNQLNHPNFLKTYGICLGDNDHSLSILLDYCPSNLKKQINKLTKVQKTGIIYEISRSMKHLHSLGIIHRDLKPDNILLDQNNHIKLTDFGTSTIIQNDSIMLSRTRQTGTSEFMAPELVQGRTDYNEKIDVYAFGVIMYFVLNDGNYPEITFMDVGRGKKSKIPKTVNKLSTDIINKCWNFDPEDRPSFADIVQDIEIEEFKLFDDIKTEDIINFFKT